MWFCFEFFLDLRFTAASKICVLCMHLEERKVFQVFLISTQWILSWLDNHQLIMNWWLSCKYMILSLFIDKKHWHFFFDSLFTLYCAAQLHQLLTTFIRHRRELNYCYMCMCGYTIQTVIQWKAASMFLLIFMASRYC